MIEIKVKTYGTDGFETNEQTKLLNSDVDGVVAVAISHYSDGSVEVSLDDDEQNGLEFGSTFMQFDNLESYYQNGKFDLVVKDVVGINFIEYSEFKLNLTGIMQACDKLKVELEKTVKQAVEEK